MSHEKRTDLRVRRTHKFLQDALVELIDERSFDLITVGDIAERAMINRATFYRHYQDKYDLLARIFEETADDLVAQMKPVRKDADGRAAVTPPEIWIRFFEHIKEHARLYRAMLGKNGSPWFVARMQEYTVKIMLEFEKQWEREIGPGRKADRTMPGELPVLLLAHALTGAIVWWLEREERYAPKQIADWFYYSAFSGYLATLGYGGAQPSSNDAKE